jgi:hypothetical protein
MFPPGRVILGVLLVGLMSGALGEPRAADQKSAEVRDFSYSRAKPREKTLVLTETAEVRSVTFICEGQALLTDTFERSQITADAAQEQLTRYDVLAGKRLSRWDLPRWRSNYAINYRGLVGTGGDILVESAVVMPEDADGIKTGLVVREQATGKQLRRIDFNRPRLQRRFARPIPQAALSGDGTTLAAIEDGYAISDRAGQSAELTVWDVASGTLRKKFPVQYGHGYYGVLAVSTDGGMLALADARSDKNQNGAIHPIIAVRDAATGRLLREWDVKCAALRFCPDGKKLALLEIEGGDKPAHVLRLCDISTGEKTREFAIGGLVAFPAECFAFSADGQTLATRHEPDKTIRVWDILTGKERYCYKGHKGEHYVVAVAVSPAGKTFASISLHDRTHSIHIWEIPPEPARIKE